MYLYNSIHCYYYCRFLSCFTFNRQESNLSCTCSLHKACANVAAPVQNLEWQCTELTDEVTCNSIIFSVFQNPHETIHGSKTRGLFLYLAKSPLARGLTEACTGQLLFPHHFFVLGMYRLMHTHLKKCFQPRLEYEE